MKCAAAKTRSSLRTDTLNPRPESCMCREDIARPPGRRRATRTAAAARSPRATLRPPATPGAAGRPPTPLESWTSRGSRRRARGPRALRGSPATCSCAAVPTARRRAGSCGLHTARAVLRLLDFLRGSPHRGRETALRDVALHHAQSEVITRPLRQHLPVYEPRGRTHPAGEEAQAQAQAAAIQLRRGR